MNGILIINKSKGFTSHDIVNVLRKELHTKKIGHTGTLDPNATGVLPVLVGDATKISKYLTQHNKEYEVEMKLGIETTTLDEEGDIVKQEEVKDIDEEKIKEVLNSFKGKQMQTPPKYSSIKINGKKAYEYARAGQDVVIPPRKIEIYNISFLDYKEDLIKFKVKCSKGTYIRVLCQDIARKLDTVAFMKNLKRTEVDLFKIEKSITIDDIKNKKVNIEEYLISIEDAFVNLSQINIDEKRIKHFLNGVKLTYKLEDGVYRIYYNNQFIGLGIVKDNLLKRDVILQMCEQI